MGSGMTIRQNSESTYYPRILDRGVSAVLGTWGAWGFESRDGVGGERVRHRTQTRAKPHERHLRETGHTYFNSQSISGKLEESLNSIATGRL